MKRYLIKTTLIIHTSANSKEEAVDNFYKAIDNAKLSGTYTSFDSVEKLNIKEGEDLDKEPNITEIPF